MRRSLTTAALLALVALMTGACASSEDWKMWMSHNTHFASGESDQDTPSPIRTGTDPSVRRT